MRGAGSEQGQILFTNSRNMATWSQMKEVFEAHWLSHFGQPEVLRVDPEGVWRDGAAADWCAERGIQLATIPAEAHWQVGIVESAIKGVKSIMDGIAEEFHDMSLHELFCRALWASNSKDNYLGFSPLQHAMGRSPDEWGHLFDSKIKGYPIHPAQHMDGGFSENIRAMAIADQKFSEFQATERLARASSCRKTTHEVFCTWGSGIFLEKTSSGRCWKRVFLDRAICRASESTCCGDQS